MSRLAALAVGFVLSFSAAAQQYLPVNPWTVPQAYPAQPPVTPWTVPQAYPAQPPVTPWTVPQAYPAQPFYIPFPLSVLTVPGKPVRRPYEMRRIIPQQEKTQMMQMMLPFMTTFLRMDMAEAMNYFARKYKAKPGLSFDDVIESMMLRANQLNFKHVGTNKLSLDFKAVLGDETAPRTEVYSFCDIAVGRELLQISPEFLVFLPCRIALIEDADKNIWVMMLDWNMDWVAKHERQLGITDALWRGAVETNQKMDEIMRAAAAGEL
jgi:uncharacterized protein (DUF302 family)